MKSPMPRTRADPSVAMVKASAVETQSAGGRPRTREAKAAARIASNMFWLSDEAEPSVPMPTVTPCRMYSRTRRDARPEPQIGRAVVRHLGALVAEQVHIGVADPDGMRRGEPRPHQAACVHHSNRRFAEHLEGRYALVFRLAHMGLHGQIM